MTHLGLLALGLFIAQSKADAPKLFPPDAATMKKIVAKTAELRAAVALLPEKTPGDIRADVEVYLKAAEWVVRHDEWFAKDSAQQTLRVLDAGLARATVAKAGKAPWRDVRGRPVARGYRSRVDGSVQPFSVTLPDGYPGDKLWRMDVVLHGRDQTLTEVKFLNAREVAKAGKAAADKVVIEPFGRGNNAYRWAGETDVFEAQWAFRQGKGFGTDVDRIDSRRVVLRGFSMGGAGTWHIGLHWPFDFAAIQPGAGFTTTRGYVRNLPADLPSYIEKCLHIYDAVDYAENAFDVPVIAYSGGNDPQKAAADNVEAALKRFGRPVPFTHLIAPGLEHKQPPEWVAKCDAEIAKHLPRPDTDRVRFVTYTSRYGDAGWVHIEALDREYEKAVIDGVLGADGPRLTTTNVRAVSLNRATNTDEKLGERGRATIRIDGQQLSWLGQIAFLVKEDGRWRVLPSGAGGRWLTDRQRKASFTTGPIDDAFRETFVVVPPTGDGWHTATAHMASAAQTRFRANWDKYFRGLLPEKAAADVLRELKTPATNTQFLQKALILFGDPGNNTVLAKVVEKLPITWTRDKLVVNGVEYDPATHLPVLIYPDPLNPGRYVVINSGHTFGEADLKGTNALLYPRLGDWAVLEAATGKVAAAGLFDENWRFEKK